MFLPARTPALLKRFYSRFVWDMASAEKDIYLTFDDGPVPGATEFVLEQLANYKAKATFFCVGDNVRKHPHLFQAIQNAGHRIGNHTQHHLNGWETNTEDYINDVAKAAELISTDIFRPPYGRIKMQQADRLLENYKIIMWDVLSYDYDKNVPPEKCYLNVVNNIRPGSIIVFHDNIKSFTNLKYALPKCLDFFKEQGYDFKMI